MTMKNCLACGHKVTNIILLSNYQTVTVVIVIFYVLDTKKYTTPFCNQVCCIRVQ